MLVACDADSPRPPIPESPTLTATAIATPVIAASDTPIVSPTPICGENVPRAQMIIGERGIVSLEDPRPLNVRAAPGTENDVIAQLLVGQVFVVLDGPECHGDYIWYYVRRSNLQGWVAEGDFSLYYILPYFPG